MMFFMREQQDAILRLGYKAFVGWVTTQDSSQRLPQTAIEVGSEMTEHFHQRL